MNNSLTLAYLGDSVFELYIRCYLIDKGVVKVNELQKEATKYVSAKGQSLILNELISNKILNDEELIIVKRARNHKSHKSPKNTDIITYKLSTGFEALIGYLYLCKKYERLKEILDIKLML